MRPGKVKTIVTDGRKSYPAAMKELGIPDRREMGRWLNNRAERYCQSK
ncbi:transposase-like protein [Croceicoccus naphthovorans]|nr:transposase-like protein [Croceicoccus naphthovorans]